MAFIPWAASPAGAGAPEAPDVVQDLFVEARHDNLADVDGEIFTVEACRFVDPRATSVRPSLAVGVNSFGTFGMPESPAGVGVGFQMPIGAESLAVGWWGEGWAIDFGQGLRTWYPSGPRLGTVERVDDHFVESSRYVEYTATVWLPAKEDREGASGLLVDFVFVIDRQTCDVVLRTTIENQLSYEVPVYYKRAVDWDVAMQEAGTFSNCWQMLGSPFVGARAWFPTVRGDCSGPYNLECRTTALGARADTTETYAWDDLTSIGPNFARQPVAPLYVDDNAGFHWSRSIDPHDKWTTVLKYECNAAAGGIFDDRHLPIGPDG